MHAKGAKGIRIDKSKRIKFAILLASLGISEDAYYSLFNDHPLIKESKPKRWIPRIKLGLMNLAHKSI